MADGLPARGAGPRQVARGSWSERALMAIGAWWRRFTREVADGYRPERHYMRGPGPKSFERNSRSAFVKFDR
jgi:hypothetical protein